jgi:anti-anti-sigma regulatory factor
MLKISLIQSVHRTVVLRLEGRVVGPWVAELQKSCEDVLAGERPLRLDLAGVEFMDARGVALLSSLRSRGVLLMDCPAFAAQQLKVPGGP